MPHKPIQHAATAPIAHMKDKDLSVPMDGNDRQEAAADNQQELQQHETKDDMVDLQQPQTWEDAAAVDGPVSAAHIMPESEDDIAPIPKVCLSLESC